jgi:hypothetical protein
MPKLLRLFGEIICVWKPEFTGTIFPIIGVGDPISCPAGPLLNLTLFLIFRCYSDRASQYNLSKP